MHEMYSSNNPKLIGRTSLGRLRQKLIEPLRSNPIGSYSRDIDVELFRLFSVPNVHETLAERTTIEAVGRMADELGFDSI